MSETTDTYGTRNAANRARDRLEDPQAWAIEPNGEGRFAIVPKRASATPKKTRTRKAAVKPALARRSSSDERVTWGQREAQANEGKIPAPLDLTAPTRQYLQKRHEEIRAAAREGNVKGLKAMEITESNSNYKALARYRDLCVTAIQHAQA